LGRLPARAVIFVIELYRMYVSPMRLPTCRFMPTCSQYAVEALSEFGLFRGGWLAAVRLVKCAPWHPGGWDPIPERAGRAHRHNPEVHDAIDAWVGPAQREESKSCVV
jgi:putative membrane protein insertion efficiency factor